MLPQVSCGRRLDTTPEVISRSVQFYRPAYRRGNLCPDEHALPRDYEPLRLAPEFCNPAVGWQKRHVEKNVQHARPSLWQLMPDFPNLMALNDWLEQHCEDISASRLVEPFPSTRLPAGQGCELVYLRGEEGESVIDPAGLATRRSTPLQPVPDKINFVLSYPLRANSRRFAKTNENSWISPSTCRYAGLR